MVEEIRGRQGLRPFRQPGRRGERKQWLRFFGQVSQLVHPHLLRHSVATTLLARGMPLELIQKFLGHATVETTQIYAESSAEMIKERDQQALAG
jgi:integrase/recombinase XerD